MHRFPTYLDTLLQLNLILEPNLGGLVPYERFLVRYLDLTSHKGFLELISRLRVSYEELLEQKFVASGSIQGIFGPYLGLLVPNDGCHKQYSELLVPNGGFLAIYLQVGAVIIHF